MNPHARIYHILESLQYGILYMIAAFIGGVGLDSLFPKFKKETPILQLFYEIALQCLLLILVVYYIRYNIKHIPFIFPIHKGSGFIPYTTPEYNGEMMMGLIFLGSQLQLIRKIDLFSQKLYTYFFQNEQILISNV
jgi:hypothetical protein